jgi:hypothetical protein
MRRKNLLTTGRVAVTTGKNYAVCTTIEVTLFWVCVPCKKLDIIVECCTFASFF